MFGRTRTEDLFEKEERLGDELRAAREQLAEIANQTGATQAEYRQAAAEAIASGNDDRAIKLRRDIEKLQVRHDGLEAKIAALEPEHQAATKAAQAERLKMAEAERARRFQELLGRGRAAAQRVVETHEEFMRAISMFDDTRTELLDPALQGLGGAHEAEALCKLLQQPDGVPTGLHGRLLSRGWTLRMAIRPTFLEIVGLIAPPRA
jgi:predicted  nucleic acid-binding Zn-ribbon protein